MENKENNNSNNKNNNNLLMSVIIILLVIIAVLAFVVWKNMWNQNTNTMTWSGIVTNETVAKDLKITVVDDKRCQSCQTDVLISELKKVPNLVNATFEKKDFSDAGMETYLKDNWVNFIPAVIFSHNNVVEEIKGYLIPMNSWEYSLQIWANFDPFAQRSERWMLVINKDIIDSIKSNSYVKWNPDAKISWIEFSDLECPYCAKLHNAWTNEDLMEKYWDDLNIVFNHFPLDFHANAMPGAEILECLWEQKWSDAFYSLIDTAYDSENSSKSYLIDEAVKLWADKEELEKCVSDNKYKDKIESQMKVWAEVFNISWTPWNILVNNETWEYDFINWAYPTSEFERIIDWLLWN